MDDLSGGCRHPSSKCRTARCARRDRQRLADDRGHVVCMATPPAHNRVQAVYLRILGGRLSSWPVLGHTAAIRWYMPVLDVDAAGVTERQLSGWVVGGRLVWGEGRGRPETARPCSGIDPAADHEEGRHASAGPVAGGRPARREVGQRDVLLLRRREAVQVSGGHQRQPASGRGATAGVRVRGSHSPPAEPGRGGG